jgi:multidrug efflux pump subunit AcrA (membrane-fusion protein)
MAHLAHTRLAAVQDSRPGLIAQQEIDDAHSKDLVAEAQVAAAKSALAAAEQQVKVAQADRARVKTLYDYTVVTAPFAGVITKRYADTGSMIQAGTASQTQARPLVRLSQNTLLRLVLPVPESAVPQVRGGNTVEVRVPTLHRSFPGSDKWPIACAGFSGGGKGVGLVAPLLAKNGSRLAGIYITGANEDRLSEGYARVGPGKEFLMTPIYVSSGRDDRIATLAQQYNVTGSIKRTGFQRIRIGSFHGGHEVNDAQTSIALRWFRELAK